MKNSLSYQSRQARQARQSATRRPRILRKRVVVYVLHRDLCFDSSCCVHPLVRSNLYSTSTFFVLVFSVFFRGTQTLTPTPLCPADLNTWVSLNRSITFNLHINSDSSRLVFIPYIYDSGSEKVMATNEVYPATFETKLVIPMYIMQSTTLCPCKRTRIDTPHNRVIASARYCFVALAAFCFDMQQHIYMSYCCGDFKFIIDLLVYAFCPPVQRKRRGVEGRHSSRFVVKKCIRTLHIAVSLLTTLNPANLLAFVCLSV